AEVENGLAARLQEESDEIERLEEVEAISGRNHFSVEQFERLEDLEENWGNLKGALDSLTEADFGLHLSRRNAPNQPGVFEPSAPEKHPLPRIRRDRLETLAPLLRGRRTFNRAIAVRNPGTQLVRVGDPMVDWLESYLRADERGRARAVARHAPGV